MNVRRRRVAWTERFVFPTLPVAVIRIVPSTAIFVVSVE